MQRRIDCKLDFELAAGRGAGSVSPRSAARRWVAAGAWPGRPYHVWGAPRAVPRHRTATAPGRGEDAIPRSRQAGAHDPFQLRPGHARQPVGNAVAGADPEPPNRDIQQRFMRWRSSGTAPLVTVAAATSALPGSALNARHCGSFRPFKMWVTSMAIARWLIPCGWYAVEPLKRSGASRLGSCAARCKAPSMLYGSFKRASELSARFSAGTSR